MNVLKKNYGFGFLFVITSVVLYTIHYSIFKDAHHLFIYLIGDIAFIPLEVLIASLIIHKILEERERVHILEKLNMVIGTFFSEVGSDILRYFSKCDTHIKDIQQHLLVKAEWKHEDFKQLKKIFQEHEFCIDSKQIDLKKLSDFIISKRQFLIKLLENSALLEHDSFTDALRAVFHLEEELYNRKDLNNIGDKDRKHLEGDMKRAYSRIIFQWIQYMEYIKKEYPYLFSLAIRLNPFDENAFAEVK